MNALDAGPLLAPAPDFRYVGLETMRSRRMAPWVATLAAGAILGGAMVERTPLGALAGLGLVAAATLARGLGQVGMSAGLLRPTAIAIVPWGVLLEFADRSRILRWPGISRVQMRSFHGRDQGTPTTHYSVVVIETPVERFVGRGAGALPLERLTAYLDDYAEEASHRLALDLEGVRFGEGPSEPDAELLLAAVRAHVETSSAASTSEHRGYRAAGTPHLHAASIQELTSVLRDRTPRDPDPRPFAAVVAAELGLRELSDDLLPLVQSPLSLLAAIAKVAATKLGVAKAKVGTLEEVEPFLLRSDAEALAEWQGA